VAAATCPKCGEPVTGSDQFCESCGTPLTATAAADPAPIVAPPDDAGTAEIGTQYLTPPSAADAAADAPASPAGERHCTCGGAIDADGWCTVCGLRAPSERDHFTEQPAPNVAAVCDRGVQHPRNEDAVALAATDTRAVLVVCDGVTSATDSDTAALAAARAARDALAAAPVDPSAAPSDRVEFWESQLNAATEAAQAAAADAASGVGNVANPPSCTFVTAVVDGPLLCSAWIGDSRSYWFGDDGTATQLSLDDSWASDEIAHGMSREAAEADPRAHSITRWLGVDSPGGDPSFTSQTLTADGWVLVCSDGLWNYCSDAMALRDLVVAKAAEANGEPLATAGALVDWANSQGGHDNITAALARVTITKES
jgi:serine/threonine protein phosphatase PrpC